MATEKGARMLATVYKKTKDLVFEESRSEEREDNDEQGEGEGSTGLQVEDDDDDHHARRIRALLQRVKARESALATAPFQNMFWSSVYPEIIRIALEDSKIAPDTYPIFAMENCRCTILPKHIRKAGEIVARNQNGSLGQYYHHYVVFHLHLKIGR